MQHAVELENVSRLYGSFAALRRVTCSFAAGGMHTLLGENGAGKSTLLRMAAGLVTPTLGTVRVLGGSASQNRHRIAYMSHAAMLRFARCVTLRRRWRCVLSAWTHT